MIDLDRQGDVFVLRMHGGENRFDPEFLRSFHAALDEVEASTGPAALVTTGEGKFYSNGLDLAWLSGDGASEGAAFLEQVHAMFGRVLAFPMATVAAVNGHAFAGGGMLALAHDRLVMREDRGYFCLPEIDLKLPLSPGMTALIQARLSKATAHEAIVTGRRYGGPDAVASGIADAALPEDEVVPHAVALVRDLTTKDRPTMSALKRGLYPDTLRTLGG